MSFIGIVTNSKNEESMVKKIFNLFPADNIIFITSKNIDNIRNIQFETVVINGNIKDDVKLKNIITKSKYVILNTDVELEKEFWKDLNLTIISYGFNNKATFTISSVSENNIIICLQRTIKNILNEKIEPQEFEEENDTNVDINVILYEKIVQLIYSKN